MNKLQYKNTYFKYPGEKWILVTAPIHFMEDLLKEMNKKFNIFSVYNIDKEEILKFVVGSEHNIEIIITNPGESFRFDGEFLSNFKNLKVVLSPSTGTNHIDKDYCKKNNIKIHCLLDDREYLKSISSSAEFTFLLMMSCLRNLYKSINYVKNGYWREYEEDLRGDELQGKNIGIIGFGRIGQKLYRYLSAFDVKEILTYDINNSLYEYNKLLENSDIIFCCLGLNKNTVNFINKDSFDRMKKNCIFINSSRGEIINEDDLIECLTNRGIKMAGVDVVCDETNIKENKLIKYSLENNNIIITPHIAGLSQQSMFRAMEFVVIKLKEIK